MTHLKIYIEGNIGSGKSTFADKLNKYLEKLQNNNKINAKIVQEPVDEWLNTKDSNGKNILEHFYEDINKWSFAFQMNSFISRTKKIDEALTKDINTLFIERSVYTDHNVFAKNCFESGKMTDMEYKIYCKWNEWLSEKFNLRPDAYVYLKCDPKVNDERIKKRSRNGEEGIPLEYLEQIHEKHETWMNYEMESGVPVLIIDALEDFTKEEKMAELVDKMINFIKDNNLLNKINK